jgi:presequence protease
LSVLPSLSLEDISRQIEFVDHNISFTGNVKTWWFDQPTNGITYVRVKANLKNLPEHLRVFVPMFTEFLSSICTKNYRYDDFNDRLLSCTNGLEVRVDKYSNKQDILDRNENLFVSVGFLDRNVDKAFEYFSEILATPNFDEPSNIADLVKMESINKANNIGNKGLEYASSYAQSGIKAFARSFESLRSDVFFCQYAAEVLKTANPLPILKDAIINMTEIASYIFREENIEFSVHGNQKKFSLIKLKLEML